MCDCDCKCGDGENPFRDAIEKAVKKQFLDAIKEKVRAALKDSGIRQLNTVTKLLMQGDLPRQTVNNTGQWYPPEFYLTAHVDTLCPKAFVAAILAKEKMFLDRIREQVIISSYVPRITLRPDELGDTFQIQETETPISIGSPALPAGGLFFSEVISFMMVPKVDHILILTGEDFTVEKQEIKFNK